MDNQKKPVQAGPGRLTDFTPHTTEYGPSGTHTPPENEIRG